MIAFHPIAPEIVDPAWADDVAAPASDALATDELAALAGRKPWSVLHATGTDLSGAAPSAEGDAGHLRRLRDVGAYRHVDMPVVLLYRVAHGDHVQLGVVGDLDVADEGLRRHEHTAVAKETALRSLRERLGVDTNPVSVAHPPDARLDGLLAELAAAVGDEPDTAVTTADGAHHEITAITASDRVAAVVAAVAALPAVYLLDGHHRLAAAADAPGGSGRVLAALFSRDQVRALDYRRVVRRAAGDAASRLAAIRRRFDVATLADVGAASPRRRGEMALRLAGRWYRLRPHPGLVPDHLPDRLDEAVVQRHLLEPVFGIADPRTDPALSYVPGTVALDDLDRRLGADDAVVVLHPLPLAELQAVADAGVALPPKSTYFTPKLAAGLVLQRRRAAVPATG